MSNIETMPFERLLTLKDEAEMACRKDKNYKPILIALQREIRIRLEN